jgi:Skp family chaperone for outer membrane proteins
MMNRMKRWMVGLLTMMCASMAHAEWKVATVSISRLFEKLPAVAECRADETKQIAALKENPRFKALEQARNELIQINKDGQNVILAYQRLKVKDENGPEAQRVKEHRTRFKNAQAQVESLKQEAVVYQKEQRDLINQELTRRYRAILNGLTDAVRKHAEERGFSMLYDSSGNSHVGVPVLLYAKEGMTTDLTAELEKMIADGVLK